jgi:hypothetical protein
MTFKEAMDDPTIKAIRLPVWANEDARLELPPIGAAGRGVWCRLIDPGMVGINADIAEREMCVIAFAGEDCRDYEVYSRFESARSVHQEPKA